jgi:hypothetical protein
MAGTAPVVTATITDADGAPADPTALVVTTRAPDGTQVDYTHPDAAITNPAVGTWVFTFPAPLTDAGEWAVYFAASGGGADVARSVVFKVRSPAVSLV